MKIIPDFAIGERTETSEAESFLTQKVKVMQGHRLNFLRKKKSGPALRDRIPRPIANSGIILALASPRRSDLLKKWGLKFSVVPSRVNENTSAQKPSSIVKELALRKAVSVAKKYKEGLVIGADTIVVLKGEIIGKPAGEKDAERILSKLNGSAHKVYSGIALVDAASGLKKTCFEVSKVKMRRIPVSEIKRLSKKHLDKAGAYAIQEKSDAFVEKIEGDYYNVVGLPYGKLKEALSLFGVKLKKFKKTTR